MKVLQFHVDCDLTAVCAECGAHCRTTAWFCRLCGEPLGAPGCYPAVQPQDAVTEALSTFSPGEAEAIRSLLDAIHLDGQPVQAPPIAPLWAE